MNNASRLTAPFAALVTLVALVALPAHADRYSKTQEGALVRLRNEDAAVSILVPPGFEQREGGETTAIMLASPGGETVRVSREFLDREAFRRSCRSDDAFRLEKSEFTDRCFSTINGIKLAQVWADPGWVVLGTSNLLTHEVLGALVTNVAQSVRFSVTAKYAIPAGFSFRNDDGTEYYANDKGLAFQVLIDTTDQHYASFTDGALQTAKSGAFGQFRSFRMSHMGKVNGADYARVDIVQADGLEAIGVLWRVRAPTATWVLTMAPPDQGEAAADLSEVIVSSVVTR
jgi:hypothetical protein